MHFISFLLTFSQSQPVEEIVGQPEALFLYFQPFSWLDKFCKLLGENQATLQILGTILMLE